MKTLFPLILYFLITSVGCSSMPVNPDTVIITVDGFVSVGLPIALDKGYDKARDKDAYLRSIKTTADVIDEQVLSRFDGENQGFTEDDMDSFLVDVGLDLPYEATVFMQSAVDYLVLRLDQIITEKLEYVIIGDSLRVVRAFFESVKTSMLRFVDSHTKDTRSLSFSLKQLE